MKRLYRNILMIVVILITIATIIVYYNSKFKCAIFIPELLISTSILELILYNIKIRPSK